jgi:hypothetical protein
MNNVLRTIFSIFICIWTGSVIFMNFTPVFLEQPDNDQQRAYENVRHTVFEHSGDTISLKTDEVLLLLEKLRGHYIEEWRSRFYHLILSSFIFVYVLVHLIKLYRLKE